MLFCPWNSPGMDTGVCSLSLLSGIFLTQGRILGLLYCSQILYHLSHYLLINLVANTRFPSFYFVVRTRDLVNKLSNLQNKFNLGKTKEKTSMVNLFLFRVNYCPVSPSIFLLFLPQTCHILSMC